MICSAVNFFPRGISCPPLVCATRDSLSESGDVEGGQVRRLTEPRTVLPGLSDEFGDPDSPLNLMDRVNAGCISRILSGSGGILEDKT